MKKIMKNRIFIVIITMLICISGTLYATTKYNANEISYNEITVEDALNDLYKKNISNSNIPEPVSFAEDSWETIVANVKAGNTRAYKVGDTKEIALTGFTNEEEGSNGLYTIRIANTSTPEECSTDGFSQTACGFVIEFVDIMAAHNMNSTNTNVGGWQDSEMRTYVNDIIYNALPKELRENIIDTYVVSGHGSSDTANFSTTDKVYLLSVEEVWGGYLAYDTATSKNIQLAYYRINKVTLSDYSKAIKNYNGSSIYWWLRSTDSRNATIFLCARAIGIWDGGYATNTTFGVAPAFRIG